MNKIKNDSFKYNIFIDIIKFKMYITCKKRSLYVKKIYGFIIVAAVFVRLYFCLQDMPLGKKLQNQLVCF